MDFEGRNLRVDFKNFSVMSLYFPSGTNINRLAFKFQYMDDFKTYINNLTSNVPNLIIGGILIYVTKLLIFMIQLEMQKFQVFCQKNEIGLIIL